MAEDMGHTISLQARVYFLTRKEQKRRGENIEKLGSDGILSLLSVSETKALVASQIMLTSLQLVCSSILCSFLNDSFTI